MVHCHSGGKSHHILFIFCVSHSACHVLVRENSLLPVLLHQFALGVMFEGVKDYLVAIFFLIIFF